MKADAQGEILVTVPALSVTVLKGKDEIVTPDLVDIRLTLDATRKVSGRVEVPAELTWEEEAVLPQTVVQFEVSVDGAAFQAVGTDRNGAPYRIYYNTDAHPAGTALTQRIVSVSGRPRPAATPSTKAASGRGCGLGACSSALP